MSIKKIFNLATLVYTILFSASTFAQKKTPPGFYISLQGDTVKGVFSRYLEWNKNPSVVEFAPATLAEPIRLTPQNCLKFVVEGHDEYLSYAGQRLVNPISDNEAIGKRYSNSDDEQEEIVTFLRLVTRTPNCELFVFNDSKRTNFFYKLPGFPVVELKYKMNYKENQLNEIEEYRSQLNSLFYEAIYRRKLTASLETLPYAEDKLKMFLEQLSAIESVKHKGKNPLQGWIVSTGAVLNFVNVKSGKSSPIAREYNSSISPLLSIGYMTPFNRNFGNFFSYPQINLFSYKNTGEINDGTFRTVTTFKSDLLISGEVNAGFNVVNQESIRVYFAGGVGMLALLNNKRLDVKYLYLQQSEPYGSSQKSISSTQPFVNASAGMVIKNKFVVAATYLFPTAIEDISGYTPQYSGLQLRIGYKLK